MNNWNPHSQPKIFFSDRMSSFQMQHWTSLYEALIERLPPLSGFIRFSLYENTCHLIGIPFLYTGNKPVIEPIRKHALGIEFDLSDDQKEPSTEDTSGEQLNITKENSSRWVPSIEMAQLPTILSKCCLSSNCHVMASLGSGIVKDKAGSWHFRTWLTFGHC